MNPKLGRVRAQIRACKKCGLWKTRVKAVPGEGSARARIMLVGEAPGPTENLEGRPFIGASGKFLNAALQNHGLKRSTLFVTNVVKCWPPSPASMPKARARTPNSREIRACVPYLRREIKIVRPKIVCMLGGVAVNTLVGDATANTLVGGFSPVKNPGRVVRRNGTIFVVCPHPAAARRFKKARLAFQKSIRTLARLARA